MFIEAIDKLRCVKDHEDSWLVAKFVEMRERDFWNGELGCPVCEARYLVRDGVVYFSSMRAHAFPKHETGHSPEELFALAAMLDLSAPDKTIVLCDEWTEYASAISEISEPHIFVVNGSGRSGSSECIYDVVSESAIPLANAAVHAVALGSRSSAGMLQSAVNVLREGGRLVAQAGVEVPPEVLLLARDDRQWVAQKQGNFIPLRRASR